MVLEIIGPDWWMEAFTFTVVVPAGAGATNSALANLTKPGRFITGGYIGRNATEATSSESMGFAALLNQSGAVLNRGNPITGLILQVRKAASTNGGTINFFGWAILKK